MNRIGLLVGFLVTSSGFAGNILLNGGFETGDLTGWTQGGQFRPINGRDSANVKPHSGDFFAFNNCVGSSCITDLTAALLATHVANTDDPYTLSFWYDLGSTFTNQTDNDFAELQVRWGGVIILDVTQTNLPDQGYVFFSTTVPGHASGGNALEFFGRNDPAAIALDDVCVSLVGDGCPTAAPAPEPASLFLSSVGILTLAAFAAIRHGRQ